jgi:LacI family transcriptional regulator
MKKVSLRDVAAKAGVSTALVSYVLNGKKANRIHDDTAARIRAAIQELGYRPNYLAQSLKRNRTQTLGLVVADISNPFFSRLSRYISDEAERLGYSLIISSSDENVNRFHRVTEDLLYRQIDGLLLAPPAGAESMLQELQQKHIPFVLVDRYFSNLPASRVSVNNHAACYTAMERLSEKHPAKVAIVAYDSPLQHLADRVTGAAEALQQQQIPYIIYRVTEATLEANIATAMHDALAQQAAAVFFTANKLGVAGVKQLVHLGIDIPGQLAVLSFDESEAFDLFPRPIPFIRQPLQGISSAAVQLLTQLIEDPTQATQVELPLEVVYATQKPVTEPS